VYAAVRRRGPDQLLAVRGGRVRWRAAHTAYLEPVPFGSGVLLRETDYVAERVLLRLVDGDTGARAE
jgi:hypothetical protein